MAVGPSNIDSKHVWDEKKLNKCTVLIICGFVNHCWFKWVIISNSKCTDSWEITLWKNILL